MTIRQPEWIWEWKPKNDFEYLKVANKWFWCEDCGHKITKEEYYKNQGSCNACADIGGNEE